jgi:CMP-N-acetylneuraminic acid synthetase
LAHDLELIEGEHFLQTHVTNPLIQVQTIEEAIAQYFEKLGEYDGLYTVDSIQKRAYTHESIPINHDLAVMLQTQDLNPVYIENSNLFIFSKSAFKAAGNNRLGTTPQAFPMHPVEGMDIDYGLDYNLAKLITENKGLFPEIFK